MTNVTLVKSYIVQIHVSVLLCAYINLLDKGKAVASFTRTRMLKDEMASSVGHQAMTISPC